jgi:hypothetical protein
MLVEILKIALAIVLARLAWSVLPIVFGALFTALLAVCAPVTALRYLFAKKTAVAPPTVPMTIKESVDKYFADYAKQQEMLHK